MTLTGYTLREAIKRWELKRDAATRLFADSLWAFEGQEKPRPVDLAQSVREAEVAIAMLQAAQARYNLAVSVRVLGEPMTLCQAVKLAGGAGRFEKLWRDATQDSKGSSRYFLGPEKSRSRDNEYARRQVSIQDAIAESGRASEWANALRAAIAVGNATEVDSGPEGIGLDAALLR